MPPRIFMTRKQRDALLTLPETEAKVLVMGWPALPRTSSMMSSEGKGAEPYRFLSCIDIGKNSCSVVGVDERGAVVVRRTIRRLTLIEFVGKLPTLYYRDGGLLWCSPSWSAL